jgi:hypothetical protein
MWAKLAALSRLVKPSVKNSAFALLPTRHFSSQFAAEFKADFVQ